VILWNCKRKGGEKMQKKVRTNIYLTPEVHSFFKNRAEQQNSTISAEVNFALNKYMVETNYMEKDLPRFLEIAEKLGIDDVNDLVKVIELYNKPE